MRRLSARIIIAIFATLALLLGTLAYAQPFHLSLDIGGAFDAPYVAGMYFPFPGGDGGYRWTNGQGQVLVRGVPTNYPLVVSFRPTADARPSYELSRPLTLTVLANEQQVFSQALDSEAHGYSFTVAPQSHELNLIFASRAWNAQNGMERRGVSLDALQIAPAGNPLPFADVDWRQVLLLTVIVVLLCVLGVPLGIQGMVGLGLLGLGGGGLLLYLARPLFALYAPIVAMALALLLLLLTLRRWPVGGLLFAGTLALYLCFNSGQITSDDDLIKYYVTDSILTRHNLVFTPLYGPSGYARYGVGHYLAEAPFLALGKLGEVMRGSPLDRLRQFSVTLMNPVVCALLVWLLYRTARRLYDNPRLALLLAFVGGTATIIFPYALSTATEPLLALWLLLITYCALRYFGDMEHRGVWLARGGLAIGMLALTKPEYVIFALIIIAWWLLRTHYSPQLESGGRVISPPPESGEGSGERAYSPPPKSGKGLGERVFWLTTPLLLAVSAIISLNLAQGLDWLGTANAPQVFTMPDFGATFSGVAGALFSAGKSIFIYSPPLLLLPFALPAFARRYRWEAALWLVLFAAALIFYGRLSFWAGDLAYGDRYLMPFIPLLLLPISALLPNLQATGRHIAAAIFVLGGAMSLLGALTEYVTAFFFTPFPSGSSFAQMYHLWQFDLAHIEPLQHLNALLHGRLREQAVTQLSYYGLPAFADFLVPALLLAFVAYASISLSAVLLGRHEKAGQLNGASPQLVPKGRFELPRP